MTPVFHSEQYTKSNIELLWTSIAVQNRPSGYAAGTLLTGLIFGTAVYALKTSTVSFKPAVTGVLRA